MNKRFSLVPVRAALSNIGQRAADMATGRALMVAAAGGLPVLSMAQTTDAFDQAVTDVTAKVNAYGPKLVGLAAVAVLFFVAMKYVKKIPHAS